MSGGKGSPMRDEITKEDLVDLLLEMVQQHCHEKDGVYDSGFISIDADAIRALIVLGKMREVNDGGGGRFVEASIGGITIEHEACISDSANTPLISNDDASQKAGVSR
jgi:hypothetical protein